MGILDVSLQKKGRNAHYGLQGFTSAPIYLSEVDLQLKQTSPSKAIGMSISPPQNHPAILRSAANGRGEASARGIASEHYNVTSC